MKWPDCAASWIEPSNKNRYIDGCSLFYKLPYSITGSIFKTLFNNSRESHLVAVAGTIDSPTTGQSELFESCYNFWSRKPENDSYSGGWEHNAQHNLESEISRKLESTSINDDGPPAFEPGKPWPGSNPVNSDPAMDPTKNPNLTPAKYHDMVNRRSNPAGQPVRNFIFCIF